MKPIDVKTADIFVSPSGNDDNRGTVESPFATLKRAREAVRERMRENSGKGVTVLFREGIYRFTETEVFGLDDSAPNGQENVFATAMLVQRP